MTLHDPQKHREEFAERKAARAPCRHCGAKFSKSSDLSKILGDSLYWECGSWMAEEDKPCYAYGPAWQSERCEANIVQQVRDELYAALKEVCERGEITPRAFDALALAERKPHVQIPRV